MRPAPIRKLFAAALLGLPAALLAHALTFGTQHAAGDGMHALLVHGATLAAFMATIAGGLQAIRRTRTAPHFLALLTASAAWFGCIERSEHSHSVPLLLCAVALVAASALVRIIIGALAKTVIAVVLAFWCPPHIRKTLLARLRRWAACAPYRPAYRFRVFSRPPPVFS